MRRSLEGRGVSPTYREIADDLGYSSVGTVAEHIRSLERKGLLRRREGKPRSLQPVGRVTLSEREADLVASALQEARGWITAEEASRRIDRALEALGRGGVEDDG